jgi:Fic family protein
MPLSDSEQELSFEEYEAGTPLQQTGYESFLPSPVNHGWHWSDARINTLLEEATQALGELNAFSRIVPDIDLFIQLHIVKEANASSRIEGTRTDMEEAIRPEEDVPAERREDWNEVQNYVRAMREAIDGLDELPLSTRLLKQTHATLMEDVRGQSRNPGEYRSSQNWIGGSSLDDAVFIPPPHHRIPELMSDLEKFWHNEEIQVPNLIRIAISHSHYRTL